MNASKPIRGIVFDIRRFSTHDGDGIRTTVFLKGCPLCCVWCQNPEGIDPAPRLAYLAENCLHCGICQKAEPAHVEMCGGRPRFDPAWNRWERVVDACPAGAVVMDAAAYTVEELMERLRRDTPFYRYGGGVTLSGGEPLLQPAFCAALLRACRTEGISTAVETSLFAAPDAAGAVLPLADQIFADCKAFDDAAHRRFTGQSNRVILRNLEALLRSPAKERVTVRTPMIPGMTATEENVAQIARFLAGLDPDVRYELLNYNPLAQAKYEQVGRPYCFAENPRRFTPGEMRAFCETARRAGAKGAFVEQAEGIPDAPGAPGTEKSGEGL